ncbi:MAG TPA: zf-TFIIB domain-containing protein [Thermomicrobiales bacterium]|nr:zf-TFIIB domain-containing protein [Thermomicrobiales bacterium]
MKCPIDQADLVMTERQGVEIDYCPTCRGVWLDRGELDKIIDRSEELNAGRASAPVRGEFESPTVGGMHGKVRPLDSRDVYEGDRDRDYDYDDDRRRPGRRKKKRESFLGDLFDFD